MEKSYWRWKNRYNNEFKNGKKRSAWGRLARVFLKAACETCGAGHSLHIHHKNRDWSDNDPGNLQTLCATCHLKWHHKNDHILPKYIPRPCRVCGEGYVPRSSRADLCNKHRKNLIKYGVEVVPVSDGPPCRICKEPYKAGTSRADLCRRCRRKNKTTTRKCAVCGTKIWAKKTHCHKHFKESITKCPTKDLAGKVDLL